MKVIHPHNLSPMKMKMLVQMMEKRRMTRTTSFKVVINAQPVHPLRRLHVCQQTHGIWTTFFQCLAQNMEPNSHPYMFFCKVWDAETFQELAEQTNLYASQKSLVDTNEEE